MVYIWVRLTMKLWLSCCLVLLSIDSKTRYQDSHSFVTWPIYNNIELIWVRSRRCGCLVTWFCYQLIVTRQPQFRDLTCIESFNKVSCVCVYACVHIQMKRLLHGQILYHSMSAPNNSNLWCRKKKKKKTTSGVKKTNKKTSGVESEERFINITIKINHLHRMCVCVLMWISPH